MTLVVDQSGTAAFGSAQCPECAVGCHLSAEIRGERIARVFGRAGRRPNGELICQRGLNLVGANGGPEREQVPRLREGKGQPLRRVDWPTAVRHVARCLETTRATYGPSANTFLGSGRFDTEAAYLFTKLFKGFLGSNQMGSVDGCYTTQIAQTCTQMFGDASPPSSYEDIERADAVMMVGADVAESDPVLFERIHRHRQRTGGVRLICLDPAKTKTAALSDVHVPLLPGSDAIFLSMVAKRLLASGNVDRKFVRKSTENFTALENALSLLDETACLARCGVLRARVDEVAQLLAQSEALVSVAGYGLKRVQPQPDGFAALVNLHLLQGAVGKPGRGVLVLRRQANDMGVYEAGGQADLLPGYRDIRNPVHRAQMENYWRIPAGTIDPRPGEYADNSTDAVLPQSARMAWIAGGETATAAARNGRLNDLDCVVVQADFIPDEVREHCDVILPTRRWGEKTGTMTSSERLVTRSQQFLHGPGETKPDWHIVCEVATVLGFHGFDFEAPETLWQEYVGTTRGTPCDQFGMRNERLEAAPLQWPCPTEKHVGTKRLYDRGRFSTESGRAIFATDCVAGCD